MNIRTKTATTLSVAIAIVITAATAIGLMANAEASYNAAKVQAVTATDTLQRMPTIVVMSEPDLQRMEAVVVTANPADYEDNSSNGIAVSDWIAPARAVGDQFVRQAGFDMPYYSYGATKTFVAKE
ncbi:MAG: hypothetical protein ABIR16_06080 [Dokdonella sp.]